VELHGFFQHNRSNARHGRDISEIGMDGEHDVEIEMAHGRGPIGLRLCLLDVKSNNFVENLQRRRQLQKGSLVLLRVDEQALCIGRVVRPFKEPNNLNPDACREIGITVDNSALTTLLGEQRSMHLVGLAGSFFAYEPVLRCLQSFQALPFRQEILHEVDESPAPEYDGVENILGALERQMQISGIVLDQAQQSAFEHACAHRLALIVGPPGTGKSFIGAELAQSMLHATSEKILVVCFTNHGKNFLSSFSSFYCFCANHDTQHADFQCFAALDQFLCHMLDKQERRIVRIGGKSKEERLEPFSLFNLKKHGDRVQGHLEKRHLWSIYSELEMLRGTIHEAAERLEKRCLSWSEAVEYLEVDDPTSLEQLELPSKSGDGFHVADGKGGTLRDSHLWHRWLVGKDPAPFSELASQPLWRMSPEKRIVLSNQWLSSVQREARNDFLKAKHQYDLYDNQLSALQNIKERAVLQGARVIGATTTGAAKYRELLEASKPGILIIEEAGMMKKEVTIQNP